jgi:hypothetical protein
MHRCPVLHHLAYNPITHKSLVGVSDTGWLAGSAKLALSLLRTRNHQVGRTTNLRKVVPPCMGG